MSSGTAAATSATKITDTHHVAPVQVLEQDRIIKLNGIQLAMVKEMEAVKSF